MRRVVVDKDARRQWPISHAAEILYENLFTVSAGQIPAVISVEAVREESLRAFQCVYDLVSILRQGRRKKHELVFYYRAF